MANDLHAYFLNNTGRRLHKWRHYFDIYETHFAQFRGKRPTVLEMGVQGGGSLEMWKWYFGEGATIIGLDRNPDCKQHEALGATIYIGSQDDERVLSKIVKAHAPFDIVLDDASHLPEPTKASFRYLYPHVQPYGVYFVEDTHTSYWENYGGGHRKPGTFVEFAKDLVDEVNAPLSKDAVPLTDFARSISSMTFYDSVVAFQKRPRPHSTAPITGGIDIVGPYAQKPVSASG